MAIKPHGAALGPVAIRAGGLQEAIALFEQKVIGHQVGARRAAHARERVKDAAQLGVVAQRLESKDGVRNEPTMLRRFLANMGDNELE